MKIKGFRAWAVYNKKKQTIWRCEDGTPLIRNRRIVHESPGDNNIINVRVEAKIWVPRI